MGLVGYVLSPRLLRGCSRSRASATRSALLGHQPLERADRVGRQPVRGDAEPACDGRDHRRADDGRLVRSRWVKVIWLLWAPWVWFSVMSTGNHYWLDIVAGVALAGVAYLIVRRGPLALRTGMSTGRTVRLARGQGAGTRPGQRARLAGGRQPGADARHAEPADDGRRLALSRVVRARLLRVPGREALLLVGAAVFVIGSLLDILDGALARAGGKATPLGAFVDSTTDRMGEAAMLGAIGLVFMRHGHEFALGATFAAVAGRSSSPTRGRAQRLSVCAATSAVVARRARRRDRDGGTGARALGPAAVGDLRAHRERLGDRAAADPVRAQAAARRS